MNITFRPMRPEDAENVYRLEKRIFKDAWSLNSIISETLKEDTTDHSLMLDDNRVIGYAFVWHYAGEVHIGNFAVIPEYQGKGCGSRLLEFILNRFKDHESCYLEVRSTNIPAIRLYEKYNFRKIFVRPRYYRDGEDAIVMAKMLQSS